MWVRGNVAIMSALLVTLAAISLADNVASPGAGRVAVGAVAGGRDHWPSGFSIAMAGGGIQGGRVLGETDPDGKEEPKNPIKVADLHSTVFECLGIDHKKINQTPIGRTVKFSEGDPVRALLDA